MIFESILRRFLKDIFSILNEIVYSNNQLIFLSKKNHQMDFKPLKIEFGTLERYEAVSIN